MVIVTSGRKFAGHTIRYLSLLLTGNQWRGFSLVLFSLNVLVFNQDYDALFHYCTIFITVINSTQTLGKKSPYSEFFWSAFSRIRTEYLSVKSEYLYEVSFRIQFEHGKMRTRKTPNTDTFHAVRGFELKTF